MVDSISAVENPVEALGVDVLPPAGHEQREVLKKRQARLDQKAAEMSEQIEAYSYDPSKLELENEIVQHFNALEVTNKQPGYHYAWVNYLSQHGRGVTYKLSIRVKGQPVWQVVRGDDMPECMEQKAVDGTRRIGDVLLMRAKKEYADILDEADREKRRRQQEGVTASLWEKADKYRSLGVQVYTDAEMDPRMMKTMLNRATARRVSGQMQDTWLREGRMPGMMMRS